VEEEMEGLLVVLLEGLGVVEGGGVVASFHSPSVNC
jgi:hypothetical protein